MYVAAYMTKDEKGMGELLKQACKENQDDVGSVFLNNRELSAQEATYRILSMCSDFALLLFSMPDGPL